MLTELRNRGVADALIVCCDGLKGLPESIRGTWPEATVQTCVVHMVRNSLRYASKRDWSAITRQMRAIYEAPTVEAAQTSFADFAEQWRETYPAMIRSWESSWDEFVPFLDFPPELRKVVYTTNAIESLNAQFRRGVRHRGHFPNEQAAMKVLYLIATRRRPNRQDLTGQIRGWKPILNTLTIHYGDRIAAAGYQPCSRPLTQRIGQTLAGSWRCLWLGRRDGWRPLACSLCRLSLRRSCRARIPSA